ncbi:MAG: hypothetical protein M3N11_06815 [Actinomycetota bacterium]|nr:hypothetical protein [Actinomycetota bacterium]
MPDPRSRPTARPYQPTALPPVTARVLAFVAIVLGGICSGLIVYSIASLECEPDDSCTVLAALGGLVGAVAGALGVAVMAVLALRAMAEWRSDIGPDGE